jgi:hypothetical protein
VQGWNAFAWTGADGAVALSLAGPQLNSSALASITCDHERERNTALGSGLTGTGKTIAPRGVRGVKYRHREDYLPRRNSRREGPAPDRRFAPRRVRGVKDRHREDYLPPAESAA